MLNSQSKEVAIFIIYLFICNEEVAICLYVRRLIPSLVFVLFLFYYYYYYTININKPKHTFTVCYYKNVLIIGDHIVQ